MKWGLSAKKGLAMATCSSVPVKCVKILVESAHVDTPFDPLELPESCEELEIHHTEPLYAGGGSLGHILKDFDTIELLRRLEIINQGCGPSAHALFWLLGSLLVSRRMLIASFHAPTCAGSSIS